VGLRRRAAGFVQRSHAAQMGRPQVPRGPLARSPPLALAVVFARSPSGLPCHGTAICYIRAPLLRLSGYSGLLLNQRQIGTMNPLTHRASSPALVAMPAAGPSRPGASAPIWWPHGGEWASATSLESSLEAQRQHDHPTAIGGERMPMRSPAAGGHSTEGEAEHAHKESAGA